MATFVLVPGAGGDAWYWHRVVPLLEQAGHRAVAVDLPAADDEAGIDVYADVVQAAIADRTDVVLVAQSMGAFTAVPVAARVPIAMLVLVNAMIPVPGESAGQWWDNTAQGEAQRAAAMAAGRDPDADFDLIETFFHDVPEEVTREAFARGEPRQSEAAFETPSLIEAWPDVPTRVVVGRDDRMFPQPFQRRVARDRLGLEVDVVPGGHLVALARPDELAERLLGYVSEA